MMASAAQEEKEYIPKEVPRSEVTVTAVRSSGSGGQNVNKVSSAADAVWIIDDSKVFTEEEKAILRIKLSSKISKNTDKKHAVKDQIRFTSQQERDLPRNIEIAMEKLNEWIAEALRPVKERVEKVPRNVARKIERHRLANKGENSLKKAARKFTPGRDE